MRCTLPVHLFQRVFSALPRAGSVAAFAAACLSRAGAALGQVPAMDGFFDDWAAIPTLATDPTGDSTGRLDLNALRAQSCGTRLFIQFDLANALNLASGPASDTTLRLVVSRGARSITIDLRNRVAYLDGNAANVIPWPNLGFVALPTTASTRFELRLDTALIGATMGNQLLLSFSGADAFSASVPFVLVNPAAPPARRGAARLPCTTLRVASFNTLFSGLADTARRAAFARLIDAVDADVYCFQEEYDSTEAQVRSVFEEADPLDDGAFWNIHKAGEFVIASPHPLVPVALGAAHLAAVVRSPLGGDTLVVTNHLKCCGYAGDSNDSLRISQSTGAVQAFNQFRAGTLSPSVAAYRNARAVVLGDMNLVGSVTPLSLWFPTPAPPSPGLTRIVPRHLIGDDAWTWASPDGRGFWPGMLDAAAYDSGRSFLVGSFLLDAGELNAEERTALGLLPADSIASDHLLMVVDFTSFLQTEPPASATACRSGFAEFTVSAAGSGPFAYQWRRNGQPISPTANSSAATGTLVIASASLADEGSYDCVVSTACATTTSAAAMLLLCTGDFNCDGGVDGGDVEAFFHTWETGEPAGDVNADGGVDGRDVEFFFVRWVMGC